MHCEPDRLLPVQFTRLLGKRPALILPGSIPGLTSVKKASALESETTQSELNGTIMLTQASILSTPFVAAYMLESTRLEPLVELLLSVLLGNLCPTGMAPTGTTNLLFESAVGPKLPHLEPLSGLPLLAPLGKLSDGHYEHADWSGRAGTIRCCEHAIQEDRSTGAGTAGAAGYVNAAGYAMPIRTTRVHRYTARGGPAGAIRQYASDRCYGPTICSGINAGYNTAGVAVGA